MARTERDTIHDTLENLIEQFSDVYCFYRELIQNSLDAGTNRVDVSLEFIPPEEGKKNGVMIIHVDDYGEGMNREIIDSQLTRLFSSSKENDFTKIGKFGIGFVSVFAIKPDAVNVDTSKDGEDWRVIFNKNKEFERRKRDYPVEGTKIQIFKACEQRFYDNFVKRSKETIELWCRHSEAEIYFQGELVNKPFDIDSPLKLNSNDGSCDIVAGYTLENSPFYGFYNKGLTLLEGKKQFFPSVSFKIKSKYLEHTMTRDNVMQDDNYWKAMESLNILVKEKLPLHLFKTMESELKSQEEETEKYQEIIDFTFDYITDMKSLLKDCKIARDTEGGYFSANDLHNLQNGEIILIDSESNKITQALCKEKKRVIKTKKDTTLHWLLKKLSDYYWKKNNIKIASKIYFMPEILQIDEDDELRKKLVKIIDDINKKMGIKTPSLKFANFDYPGSCIKDWIYVMQKNPGKLSLIDSMANKDKTPQSIFSLFCSSMTLVLNANHAYVKNLLKLAGADVEMAAYLLSKLLYIDDGVATETDSKLVSISLERRLSNA